MSVELSTCVQLVRDTIDPNKIDPNTPYIGLEHISEGALALNSFGFAKDVDSNKSVFKKGDILFGKLRPYFRKVIIAPFNGVCSTDIWVIRPKKGHDRNFIFYWLASKEFIDHVNQSSEGTRMPRAQWDIAKNAKKPYVQNEVAIGNTLRNLDDKIANNTRINQTLEAIAQVIFKSWFVDFDPVKAKMEAKAQGVDPQLSAMMAISGKTAAEINQLPAEKRKELAATADLFPDEMEESELGDVPKGWKVISLYDTAEYVNGGAFKASDFSKDKSGLPIIKIAELKSGISPQTEYTTNEIAEKYRINTDDMLYSWSGSPETSLEVFKWFGGEGWLNQHIFKINTQSLKQKVYVYYLLKYLKPQLIEIAKNKQTTGLGHVTVADMKRIKVVLPNKKGIKLIINHLISQYEMSSNCMKQNMVLAEQRDSLLPRLLSGELSI